MKKTYSSPMAVAAGAVISNTQSTGITDTPEEGVTKYPGLGSVGFHL